MKHLFILLFISTSFSLSLSAQEKCKTDIILQKNIAEYPEIEAERQRINEFTERWIADPSNHFNRTVVTIPVVVHVIWNTPIENISDAQIQSQMTVLNDDFRKLNSNFSTTPAAFQNIAADTEIEFCLAAFDPAGNPTNGITRKQTSINEIGETEDYYDPIKGSPPWDNKKYLNIWVCGLSYYLYGYAYPPGTAVPNEADGVVIAPHYFGTIGSAASSAPAHLGRTTTHEIGHYFNLSHVWGDGNGGCNQDDHVNDTPLQDVETYGCETFPLLDNCTNSGNGVNFHNYLDYTDDGCMTMFTTGQKMRMLAALNGPRAGLLASTACGVVSVKDLPSERIAFTVFPNPASDVLHIELADRVKSGLTLQLTDLLGNRHLEFDLYEGKPISVSDLPNGIYLLSCKAYPMSVEKLVVAR